MKETKILLLKIRKIVKHHDLKYDALSDIWDICPRTVRAIFAEKRPLTISELYTFAKKFNMKVEELIKVDDEKLVMHNTFNHQQNGNGVVVNQVLPEGERELLLQRIADKDSMISRLDTRVQKLEEEIEFLREMFRTVSNNQQIGH